MTVIYIESKFIYEAGKGVKETIELSRVYGEKLITQPVEIT